MRRRGWFAGAIAVSVVVAASMRGVARRFAIREASMAPTLAEGDWVVARRRTGPPDRGDIVILRDPAGSGMHLVKRVIGLPGETMGVDGGRVTVDGALLADRWANGITLPDGTWEVGDGQVWLLGDNRAHSVSDGRVLGPTDLGDIEWLVVARYWPRSRVGRM